MLQSKHHLMTTRRDSARYWRGQLFALVALAWAFSAGSAAVAHDDPEEDEAEPVAAERQVVLSEQQFDQMVFGGSSAQRIVVENGVRKVVAPIPNTEADARKRMESALQAEMQAIHIKCSLTDAQKKKLQLAGRGDIADFCSRVHELRTKCTAKAMSQQQYNEVIQELQPLRYLPQYGALGESSLFRKTLRNLLNDEQLVRYRSLERERRVTLVEGALRNWDRTPNGVKLAAERRKQFITLLADHGQFPQGHSPYAQYIVLLETARLEERLKPLFNDHQWRAFQTQLMVARRVEPTLRHMGHWPISPASDDDSETSSDTTKE
jgi:hypothetical protein